MSAALQVSGGQGLTVLPLKKFQSDAKCAFINILSGTAALIEVDPSRRQQIALAQGVTLLRSPTASGKTLTVGRTLEECKGTLPKKTCWFWFAPFSGLISQTREALGRQCPGVRLRDARTDRAVHGTRDGDVFVMTWASVASSNKEARLIRQEGEEQPSIDVMIAALRASSFYIGVVIDEAHVNFGMTANQAADFYLTVLRPDFTFLVTATPRAEELERFERHAGIGAINRVDIARDEVVKACLNKVGIKSIHFRADPRDVGVLDMAEVAIFAGLQRHDRIKAELKANEIDLVPLLLIQVENESKGGPDPVEQVKRTLLSYGVKSEVVAVHTSGQPDPFFHTLAYDESKEILIFKVAAATGFDAPRAWTLVSLRQTTGVEFGLQILGRIMRVHPRVQHLHPYASEPPRTAPDLLDFGYVFLANPEQQPGMVVAAQEIKTIRDGIQTVTDNAVVIDFGSNMAVLLNPDDGFGELLVQRQTEADTGTYEFEAVANDAVAEPASADAQKERTRAAASQAQSLLDLTPSGASSATSALNGQPPQERGVQQRAPESSRYPLRDDIAFPRNLSREVLPRKMDKLVQCIADKIEIGDATLSLIRRTRGKVVVTEEDVFTEQRDVHTESVPLSPLRIAQQAQLALRFNQSIDERDLLPAVRERLRREIDRAGLDPLTESELRRAVNLIIMARPHLLHEACRACLALAVDVLQNEALPSVYEGPPGLETASKSLYCVFPTDMNKEELAFARILDEDQTGTVLWWLRNVSNARWAVSIVLPTGERHFPDFVIGVDSRRRSEDSIALVEIKDDGTDGRLFSTKNTDKVRTEHSRYRSALMVFRDEHTGEWINVAYQPAIQRHVPTRPFSVNDLVWTQ